VLTVALYRQQVRGSNPRLGNFPLTVLKVSHITGIGLTNYISVSIIYETSINAVLIVI
jgi:hypothetical protein